MWSTFNVNLTLVLLSLLHFAIATPVDAFTDLKCHCISFSPVHRPIPCQINGSQNLTWTAARDMAFHRQMQIQFASQTTVTRVLNVATPLPTNVLLSMSDEMPLALDQSGSMESASKIICGLGDEVRWKWMEMEDEEEGSASDWFVLQVVLALILLIILYDVVEVAWTMLQAKYFPNEAPIRLSGDEKRLIADAESETTDYCDLEVPHCSA